MRHMVDHVGPLRSNPIQNGGHYLITNLVGMESIVMPHHNALLMNQVFENLFRITSDYIVMVVTVNKEQVELLMEAAKIETSGIAK